MVPNQPPERALGSGVGARRASEGSEPEGEELPIEEQELDALAEEVQQMANKIRQYRATLPDQLKTALASLLSSQRPLVRGFDSSSSSHPGPSGKPAPDASTSALPTEEDQHTAEKVVLLKDKVARNASSMPVALKRMRDCMSKIDMLGSSSNGEIHPAFREKRTS
ncbi:unnamed protein product [Linum tenue]|uniref:Uncharacterized protein n=1 Tax=Linum tenue TaxID=586396 RepID=A0AAV0PHQ4_9ROSI|nr:unnamed protein product [Linum tenue]